MAAPTENVTILIPDEDDFLEEELLDNGIYLDIEPITNKG